MTRQLSRSSLAALVAVALALPASAGQRNQGAVTSGGSDSRGDGGGRSAGGDSGGGRVSGGAVSRPSGGGESPRSSGAPSDGARARSAPSGDGTRSTAGAGSGARRRGDREAVGQAIPRPAPSAGGGTTIITTGGSYYGGYYPWGYGGLGLGGYYGWYDPWWYDPVYYGYGGYGRYSTGYEGRLRLKVKPNDAEVFVDGYYAGVVDEFDNAFQSLSIETGPHRIEVREDGYEPLTFEVRILPDRTVTYRGELKRLP